MPRLHAASYFPSLNFLVLCLLFSGTGAALWHGLVGGQAAVLVFAISGWIVSLCLHEFAHAVVAYTGGDRSIPATGYLTLDPLKYADPFLSIVLPVIYIAVGGFGLPGGSVWVRHGALRSRLWDSAVSVAGPAANVLFLLMLGWLHAAAPRGGEGTTDMEAALAVSAYFQATAIVLNLLPIPGLDGFGIIRPWLPGHVQAVGNAMAAGAGLMLLLLVLNLPAAGRVIFQAGYHVTDVVGIGADDVYAGSRYLRFF